MSELQDLKSTGVSPIGHVTTMVLFLLKHPSPLCTDSIEKGIVLNYQCSCSMREINNFTEQLFISLHPNFD